MAGRRTTLSGVLGVVAVAAIALVIYFSGGGCVPAGQSRHLAPDGVTEARVAIATCRRDTEVSVELTESGKTYMLLLASSPQPSPNIQLQWSSPSLLELRYPAGTQVRIPPDRVKVRNFFGTTEVIYRPQ